VTLLLATTNPHKLAELRALLRPLGIRCLGLPELDTAPPPPAEDEDTFAGNARQKATAYARALGLPCLADDSGLIVDALGGAPGVRSARYAGEGGTREERDRANRAKLWRELARVGAQSPTARLVCALCLADAQGDVLFEAQGTWSGVLQEEARGTRGFGYDVHLFLPALGRTAAELTFEETQRHSHRAEATQQLVGWLQRHPGALTPE
jgi:XTP/dITP diphosphohydrolase